MDHLPAKPAPSAATQGALLWALYGALPLPDITGHLLSTCDYWASDRPHQHHATGPPTGPPAALPLRITDTGPPSQRAPRRAA